MENQVQSKFNEPMPKTWLLESILVTLFCCLPLGIVGIINAANVSSKYESGDIEGAKKASAEAAKWTKYGFIAGIVVILVYLVFIFLIGGSAIATAASEQY
ncbi:MAG TPA: CD225/dispanin family protein [Flavobacteriia bacterium]|jgi:hypothetical protein|nr:CD225/dispanin family protein [Flavobacteriia bacterium]